MSEIERGHTQAAVDTSQPALYFHARRLDPFDADDSAVMQLTYTYWFPSHPHKMFLDLEAGKFEGLTFRVTLNESGGPMRAGTRLLNLRKTLFKNFEYEREVVNYIPSKTYSFNNLDPSLRFNITYDLEPVGNRTKIKILGTFLDYRFMSIVILYSRVCRFIIHLIIRIGKSDNLLLRSDFLSQLSNHLSISSKLNGFLNI